MCNLIAFCVNLMYISCVCSDFASRRDIVDTSEKQRKTGMFYFFFFHQLTSRNMSIKQRRIDVMTPHRHLDTTLLLIPTSIVISNRWWHFGGHIGITLSIEFRKKM